MAGSSDTYHEPLDKLSPTTQDMHRALVSLQEELEAVDWYQQRADACGDGGGAGISHLVCAICRGDDVRQCRCCSANL